MTRTLLLVAVLVLAGCAGTPQGAGPCPTPCDPCGPSGQAGTPPSDMPEGVNAGEAWCRVWVPEEYATVVEKVCVNPASTKTVQIPAKYGTRPKLVCCEEARMCEQTRPAQWKTEKVRRMVCPPRSEVRRICCPPTELGPCEVQTDCWTKVEHPPVYCEEDCPVCIEPERRWVEYTPAQYKVVPERFLITPARCEQVCVPPVYENRCRKVCVRPGRWEWRRNTACEVPGAPATTTAPMPAPAEAPAAAVPSLEIQDSAASGEEGGTFAVGDVVRYDVEIAPAGAEMKGVHVAFTLPADLEFVEGTGDGVTIDGEGQSAKTSLFDLAGSSVHLSVMARVVNAPESNLVQLSAKVVDADGNAVVEKTESTVLKP